MVSYFKTITSIFIICLLLACAHANTKQTNLTYKEVIIDTISYSKDLKPIIMVHCSPCHTGGRNSDLHIFEACKEMNDENIRRIQLPNNDDDFMPIRKPKLSDSLINIFIRWGKEGYKK